MHSKLFLPDESYVKGVIIFGADISPSVHIDNKVKNIPTQGLHDTTVAAEAITLHNQIKDLY